MRTSCLKEQLLHVWSPARAVITFVTIQSGDRNLVVVNGHFEPDLTLRSLREETMTNLA